MTDDESRKAFKAWYQDEDNLDGASWQWPAWQAAVEWATKRERERCADWAWKAREAGHDALWIARRIEWIEQEPKP